MTAQEIIGLCVSLLVMLVGLIGSIVPVLPGTPVILLAAIIHRLIFGDHGASTLVLICLTLLTLLSFGFDYLASMYGAKKLGATRRGVIGAVVGGIVGLFFSIPGIILGPFVGAVIFEMAGGRHIKPATRAGMGAMLGLLAGAVGKLAICMAMIGVFTLSVIIRSVA